MLHDFISENIRNQFPHKPTEEQEILIDKLGHLVANTDNQQCFLIQGYAGTGKTTIVGALVRTLAILKRKSVLLAPTGRAAKVFSNYSGFPANTIHKKIYRQKSISESKFQLSDNLHKNTIFIVDEASMISNIGGDSTFGTGYLLDDLVEFVFSGDECNLILLGDDAQLPPIEQPISPALDSKELEMYGLNVEKYTLTQVVRQEQESGILQFATYLRMELNLGKPLTHPIFPTIKTPDVKIINGIDLVEYIEQSYRAVGIEDTIIITRSNKRANQYNNGIRSRVLMCEEELSSSDLLMVTKNNYFWNKDYDNIEFIANGEVLEISRIRKHSEMYGYRFADLTLRSLDYDWELDARILIEGLQAENPNKMSEINQSIFIKVAEDYPEIGNKRTLYKKIFENEYYNALQVKFAYAITCHKAQGGQWRNVFIDHSYIHPNQLNEEYYRWLYTAITRATENLFLVNYPTDWFN